MKNLFITAIIASASIISATAQTQQGTSFILNQHLTGNQHYKASQFVEMNVAAGSTIGFQYIANGSNEFIAEIDPFMVFPPTGGELGGPIGNENIVGNDGVVGATKGSLSVNDAGSAVYQIPLEFPGGISGMTPELSLVYNSSGSDGILGPGWSLGGLSVITCVPATRYHNGIRQSAYGNDFEDGAYTLDGQRLVPVFYKDDINFREYRTEMNVFSKIMRKPNSKGERDEAGKYFEVITKSGLTYIYGKSEDSRHSFYHTGTSKKYTISYYVNSISDNMGNKITFEYTNNQAEGEISIKSIKYTFTDDPTGSMPIYSIDFFYKERPDVLAYYLAYKTSTGDISVKTSTSKVIDSISCKHISTNTIVKEYKLDYILRGPGNDDTKKTLHLNSIQEYGKNREEKYNKTVFEWEIENNEIVFEETRKTIPPIENELFLTWIKNIRHQFVDIDNDGKLELIRTYQKKEEINSQQIYFNFFLEILKEVNNNYTLINTYRWPDFVYVVYTIEPSVILSDFNGDGFPDLLVAFYNNNGPKTRVGLSLGDGTTFGPNHTFLKNQIINQAGIYQSFIGDFNGDGISDVWFAPTESTGNQIWRLGNKDNPLEGNNDVSGDISLTYAPPITLVQNTKMSIVDFNGDGRSDIRFGNDKVYLLKPVSGQNTIQANSEDVSFSDKKEAIVNKDNKPDYISFLPQMLYENNLVSLKVTTSIYLNNGISISSEPYKTQTLDIVGPYLYYLDQDDYFSENFEIDYVTDLNGDGLSDFVCNFIIWLTETEIDPYTGEEYTFTSLFEKGKVIFLSSFLMDYTIQFNMPQNISGIQNFNIDNQTDLYWIKMAGSDFSIYTDTLIINSPTQNGYKISSIINGTGHETAIEYSFTGDPEVYTPGAEVEYPVIPYEASMRLVKKIKRSNGFGGLFTEQYKYEKARAHTEGLGFIGFEKITRTDVTRGIESITEYGLDTEFFVSYPSAQTTKLVNGPIIEQTFNEYIIQSTTVPKDETTNLQDYSGRLKYYFVRPDEMKTYSYELKTNKTESYNYKGTYTKYGPFDPYGNPSSIVTEYEDFSNTKTEIFRKTTQHTYAPADTLNNFNTLKFNWVLGRLTESSTEFEATGVDKITKKSEFSYYPPDSVNKYGMLFEEREYKYNSDIVLTTKRYSHDKYGNITTSVTSAEGCDSCHIIKDSTNYTLNGRFVRELINSLGYKTIRHYDALLGTLLTEQDINALETTFQYDGFGRLEKGIAPDGTISASALRWVAPGDPQAPANSVYYSWQQTSGKPEVKVYYNSLGMELRSVTNGFNELLVYVDSHYNEKGQLWKKSAPYNPDTETPKYAENTYDRFNRVKTTTIPEEGGNAITTNTYTGFTISTKNALNQTNSKTLNAAGWTVKSTDNTGNSVIHTYYADGAVKSTEVENYDNTRRNYIYDDAGNLEEYKDASQGTIKYVYNAYRQLIADTNAMKKETTYKYDILGRIISKKTFEGTFTYQYDQQKNGLLDYVDVVHFDDDNPDNRVSYTYDNFLRPITQTETIGEETFVTTYEYDELGRLQHLTYPSDYKIRNTYTDNGYPLAIIDTEDDKKLWEAKHMNARGQFTNVNVGDIAQTFEYYQNSGRIWKIKANGLQNNTYTWDKGGNLKTRTTRIGKFESFDYDNLNRLSVINHNWQLSFSYRYDALGNITHKSDVGDYAYANDDNPYKLTSINNKPATINNENQVIDYNSFNKVYKITETDPLTSEIKRQLDLLYGVDNSRVKQIITENGIETSSKLYIGGSYEVETKNGETSLIHYINAPTGLVAIVTKKGNHKETEFVLNDHLGSMQVLATRAGGLLEEFSYDAWGMRRDPATFEVFAVVPPGGTAYGFTGHEHIDLFMLVNMDGRMYDPVLGRFLSPDPVLQFPNYTQGLNPYSYALNNPLRFVDSNGYSLVGQLLALTASTLVGIVSGGNIVLSAFVYSVIMTIDHAIELGRAANFDNLYGYFIQTFVMSSISAGVTKGIGGVYGETGKIGRELARAATHGTFNGAMRMAQGGKFEHGFLSGFVSSLGGSYLQANGGNMSGAERIAISAAIGGTAEALGGGKFANGAVTGAYVMALNHMGQETIRIGRVRKIEALYAKLSELQQNKGEHTAYEVTEVGNEENKMYFLDFDSSVGSDGDHSIVRSNILDILDKNDGNYYVSAVIHSQPASPYATGYDLEVFGAFPAANRIEIVFGTNNQVSVYYKILPPKSNFDRPIESYNINRKLNTYRYDEIRNY
ncbi:MAG: RHS repeat-associated core domain [Bacteroidetes bacterium]|nr:MAG: RHS repeat-associated core domain [Bacteroidota bacterium]